MTNRSCTNSADFGFPSVGTSLPEPLRRTIPWAARMGNFFYFFWPSLEVLSEQFCLWLLAVGNFSNCVSTEQFFPKTRDHFQGSIPAELDLISSKARTDDHHPKQRVPQWDIRADVIRRRDNRITLQHTAVTSLLVKSFLAQHILLNWDVLFIRILLRQSF